MDVSGRSTAQLVSDSIDDVTKLFRKEAELLRIGIEESVSARLKGVALIAGAVLIVLPGLFFVLVGAVLAMPWSPQIDLLIGGAALMAACALAVAIGVKRVKGKGAARSEALDRVKEDVRWARERLRP